MSQLVQDPKVSLDQIAHFLAIVKALVEAGALLDVKNFYNGTPLSVAC